MRKGGGRGIVKLLRTKSTTALVIHLIISCSAENISPFPWRYLSIFLHLVWLWSWGNLSNLLFSPQVWVVMLIQHTTMCVTDHNPRNPFAFNLKKFIVINPFWIYRSWRGKLKEPFYSYLSWINQFLNKCVSHDHKRGVWVSMIREGNVCTLTSLSCNTITWLL